MIADANIDNNSHIMLANWYWKHQVRPKSAQHYVKPILNELKFIDRCQ